MKKIYLSPKVKTVVLDSCSLMAASVTGGGQGTTGEHGNAKRQLLFFDEVYFEDEDDDF